jgi:hypothetical protein
LANDPAVVYKSVKAKSRAVLNFFGNPNKLNPHGAAIQTQGMLNLSLVAIKLLSIYIYI